MKKYTFLFVSIFIAMFGAHLLILTIYIQSKKDNFLKLHNESIEKSFNIVGNNFSRLSESMFKMVVDKPDVLEKIAKAYGDQKEKNSARNELYNELLSDYEYFRELGVTQFQFHLKNNESFLYLENPNIFEDNLTAARDSIGWVKMNQEKTEGFEDDASHDEFYYVFPLIKSNGVKKEHLGNVEFVFCPYVFIVDFINSQDVKAEFITASRKNILAGVQSKYIDSPFSGFLYSKSIKKELGDSGKEIEIERIKKSDIERASEEIFNGDIFSIPSEDSLAIFTFIPIKNPVSKKIVSAIILQESSDELKDLDNQFLLFLFSGYGAALIVMLYIYREFSSRVKFQEISKKTQKILDAQEAIVVILNRAGVSGANKKFLDFFGFEKLTDFKAKNRCVCERFEQNDKFFHMGKAKEDSFWIDALEKLGEKEHMVSMKDKDNKLHSFAIFINTLDDDYIVSFSDISETMREHFSLEQKAMHDSLTNAYNREYFQGNIRFVIEESYKKGLNVGVIMFDVDHFKIVNDTYGHSVGDSVLKYLVWSVKRAIRGEDLLIRWGGEEFLLIVQTKSTEALTAVAQKLRKTIENEDFDKVGKVTCSFGITLYRDNEDISESVKRADIALYEAKESGRNSVISRV